MGGIATNGYSSEVSILNKSMNWVRAAPIIDADIRKKMEIKCRNFGGSFVTRTNEVVALVERQCKNGFLKKSLLKFTHLKFEENESEFNKLELLSDLDAI